MKLQHSKRSTGDENPSWSHDGNLQKGHFNTFLLCDDFLLLVCEKGINLLSLSLAGYYAGIIYITLPHNFAVCWKTYFSKLFCKPLQFARTFSMIRWEIHITNIITNFEPNKKSLFVSKSRDTLSKNVGPLSHIEGWSDDYFVGVRVQYLFF